MSDPLENANDGCTVDLLKKYDIPGDLGTGNTMATDESAETSVPLSHVLDKGTYLQDRFMLDFLTVPEIERLGKSDDGHVPPVEDIDFRNELSKEHDTEDWWESDALHSEILGEQPIVQNARQRNSAKSEILGSPTLHTEGVMEEEGSENGNHCPEEEDIVMGGTDTRRRRRREFHKIHTRRSRAKLNEKMEMLRHILPDPPNGLVIKSKAQIIDYAISIIAQWSSAEVSFPRNCSCAERLE